MSSKDRFQRRARCIQKQTGWSYMECLRLSQEEISDDALDLLIQMRQSDPIDRPLSARMVERKANGR